MVSMQAAKAFMNLYKLIGSLAIDEIIPVLLELISQSGTEESNQDKMAKAALFGLQQIVSLRPRDLLEYLLPIFMTSPIQIDSAK